MGIRKGLQKVAASGHVLPFRKWTGSSGKTHKVFAVTSFILCTMAKGCQVDWTDLLMNRFPTWQIWKLLHTYPRQNDMHLWLRALHVKPFRASLATFHNVWIWIVLNFIVTGAIFFIWFIFRQSTGFSLWINVLIFSFFITLDSYIVALKITASISKWRAWGNYDLFTLPDGELTNVLNICRAHRFRLDGKISGIKLLLILLILGFFYVVFLNRAEGLMLVGLLIMWIPFAGLMRCVDYVQSFTAATLIALLATQRQIVGGAQTWLIGGFCGLQIGLYVAFLFLLNNLPSLWMGIEFFPHRFSALYLSWLVVFAPLIFMLCREIVNFLLWQAVKRRLEA